MENIRDINMNKLETINFLKSNQPLPSDLELTQTTVDKYEEIIQYFIKNPDDDMIPLFLNSYGAGDGLGTYVLVEGVLHKCTKIKVIEEIRKILENQETIDSIRYWATQNAAAFLDPALKKGLLISSNSDIEDIREAANIALDMLIIEKP